MSNRESSSDDFYRDLIIKELKDLVKELVESQKGTNSNVNEVLDRLKTIEIVVVGLDGKNCLLSRVEALERRTDILLTFKTKAIAIVTVIYTIIALIVTAIAKYSGG